MHQLFLNLIGNALKFHKPDVEPHVKIYANIMHAPNSPGSKVVQICVEDNGIGFNEKYLDRIFQPFQRLHSREEYQGSGIGLAICRKIVLRHNGDLTAKSTPNEGSTFIITLPVKQPKKTN
jgi:signal transduction histidine kinase